ncbi:MAG: type IV secretory system conjugative DNA transfer family protein [Eubacteriales bacterium]
MKKKEKIHLTIFIMSIATIFSIFFTATFARILVGIDDTIQILNPITCFVGLFTVKGQGMMFLAFELFALLCCFAMFSSNEKGYQSELVKVTEDIETPAPVGQNQHGSARWLTETEKDEVFQWEILDRENRIVKYLVESGYDSLDFMKVKQKSKKPKNNGGEDLFKLYTKGGIVVGRKIPKKVSPKDNSREKIHFIGSDSHTLTIGATRSGKSRCLVIQSICTLGLGGESIVVSDPKGELFQYTNEFLEKIGYEIICLDFKNPQKSTRYNLLQPVIDAVNEGDMEKAEMYAWDITNILVGDDSASEKIWENGEKSTVAGAILCVVVDNKDRPEYQNLTNVYWFIAEMGKNVNGKTPMDAYMAAMDNNHPARALLSIAAVAPSRTKGSFDTSALTTLRLFTSKSMYGLTSRSDFELGALGEKKMALFIILPDEKTTYYPVASLIVSQMYEMLVSKSDERGGRLLNRVNFVLDEFGNFAAISGFDNKLTVAGGRGMRFNLFLQSFEQLTDKYSREMANIVKANCQTWTYLQADDDETLEAICKKLGKYTTSAYQLSSQHGKNTMPSSSHSVSLVARDLLTTDEIHRISRPHQIVVGRSHPALMIAPDLSQWQFNKMLGLGDEEHNRKVREERENKRKIVTDIKDEIPLWEVWKMFGKSGKTPSSSAPKPEPKAEPHNHKFRSYHHGGKRPPVIAQTRASYFMEGEQQHDETKSKKFEKLDFGGKHDE